MLPLGLLNDGEPMMGRDHRDHFICTACGDVVELENLEVEELVLEAARQHGFSVESLKLELHGTCSSCLGDAERARE